MPCLTDTDSQILLSAKQDDQSDAVRFDVNFAAISVADRSNLVDLTFWI